MKTPTKGEKDFIRDMASTVYIQILPCLVIDNP